MEFRSQAGMLVKSAVTIKVAYNIENIIYIINFIQSFLILKLV